MKLFWAWLNSAHLDLLFVIWWHYCSQFNFPFSYATFWCQVIWHWCIWLHFMSLYKLLLVTADIPFDFTFNNIAIIPHNFFSLYLDNQTHCSHLNFILFCLTHRWWKRLTFINCLKTTLFTKKPKNMYRSYEYYNFDIIIISSFLWQVCMFCTAMDCAYLDLWLWCMFEFYMYVTYRISHQICSYQLKKFFTIHHQR